MEQFMKFQKEYDLFSLSKYRNEIYGFSLILILFYHACLVDYNWTSIMRIFKIGYLGVEIFLFLSGISLFFSYTADHNLIRFYKKRLIRLLVPAVIILTPYYIYVFSLGNYSPAAIILKTIPNVLLLQFWIDGSDSSYFLSLMMVCYLFYPLLYKVVSKDENAVIHITKAVLLCIAQIAVCVFVEKVFPAYWEITNEALARIPVFTAGCFLGPYVYKHKKVSWLIVPICAMLCALLVYPVVVCIWEPVSMILVRTSMGILCTIVLSCIFKVTASCVLRFLNRICQFLSTFTIEMYLIHIRAIILSDKIPFFRRGSLPAYAILILCSLLVSYLYSFPVRSITGWLNKKLV